MSTEEIRAWLGDFADELTAEQAADLARIADEIAARYPDPDDEDERQAALTVAHRLMLEDPEEVVTELGDQLLQARLAEARATAAVKQAAHVLVRIGDRSARGIESAAGFATAAGVDRQAVREWLGARSR